ncbi:DUF72 domain-containing protein [Pseudoxanthomonas wuyuanensis]|uniref:Uncharacterized conserved protein YecE, DUF72 family n=1 Tax=Pseudoxanthomonas wuyuanensis TaxID=1073196 RepID=A0A286DDX8_9GAMM|nr:DUF72 domain-containing protein [Pseudoxanthomonas wuyuanensis]KAF1720001.1 DUF72 domain-containing protein [Pseudoxanthomonas wuyuanensis]SOD56854.1 Uncharacterized conserved protein YecE, DUF72 family [Pseudoxanthomonas wuyuanensis]
MDDLFPPQGESASLRIRVGIGGWNYAPWRKNFYPAGLPQRRELEYASRQVSAIEINSTYYGTQKPATYAKWRDETPAGFVFSAKAPKRIMQARSLAGAQAQIEDFIGGIGEIGDKLGPLVWQFEKGRQVDLGELQDFLAALPRQHDGRSLRHALEIRDPARVDGELIALARRHAVATVFTDSQDYPSFADLGGDFVYARLMRSRAQLETGYPPAELAQWADRARRWARGQDVPELPHAAAVQATAAPRDVFVYFISSAKERNPAAAMALLRELSPP